MRRRAVRSQWRWLRSRGRDCGPRWRARRPAQRRAAADRPRVRDRARERVGVDHVRGRARRRRTCRRRCAREGAYLPNYYAVGHESNDNYIAMISGQAPNAQNQADCQFFDNLVPGTIGIYGQATGSGCVYPADVPTIADQLSAAGLTWRDYNEDMGADPTREASECGHPGINSVDNTQKATATDEYATRHDPFVYFHSIIDDTALCDSHVVNLSLLPHDLASAADTPNYVFITPDLCDDGHDSPCANGQPGGLAQADAFLRQWVPQITSSPAFDAAARPVDHHLRRGRHQRHDRLLRRDPRTRQPRARRQRTRRRRRRRGAAVSVHRAGHGVDRRRTTTTRCCEASRTCSACRISATPGSRRDVVRLGHLHPAVHGTAASSSPPPAGDAGPCAGDRVERRRRPAYPGELERGSERALVHRAGPADERPLHGAWRTLLTSTTKRSLKFAGRLGRRMSSRSARSAPTARPARWSTRHDHRADRPAPRRRPLSRRVARPSRARRMAGPRDRQLNRRARGSRSATPVASSRSRRTLAPGRPHPRDARRPQPHDRPPLRAPPARQLLFLEPRRFGHHRLTIRVLSGTVALEGLAIGSRSG